MLLTVPFRTRKHTVTHARNEWLRADGSGLPTLMDVAGGMIRVPENAEIGDTWRVEYEWGGGVDYQFIGEGWKKL